MEKRVIAKKFWLGVVTSLIFIICSTNAFASGWSRDSRERNSRGGGARDRDDRSRPREVVVVGHHRYNYHDGRFFWPGWFGFEIAIATPPVGAIVTILPFGHRTIVLGGATYYYYNNIYYQPCSSGYIIVPQPQAKPAVVAAYSGASTINVPNSNGSYTSVTLVKRDNGYIGPQGEYYPDHPTVDQLKALYGK